MAFTDDIQSRDTALFPVVEIGVLDSRVATETSIRISIKPVTLFQDVEFGEGEAQNWFYSPLLLSSPSIKESIDLESRKYKISNITLKVSNVIYNGERISDNQELKINNNVNIIWSSPSVEISGRNNGYWAYFGVIRAITHDEKTCNITLEDISQSTLHRDVPVSLLSGDVIERYKNKPVPMVYGVVDKSPVVIISPPQDESQIDMKFIPDRTLDIGDVPGLMIEDIMVESGTWGGVGNFVKTSLYIYKDRYIGVLDVNEYAVNDGFFENEQIYGDVETNRQYLLGNRHGGIGDLTVKLKPTNIEVDIIGVYENLLPEFINHIYYSDIWADWEGEDWTMGTDPLPSYNFEVPENTGSSWGTVSYDRDDNIMKWVQTNFTFAESPGTDGDGVAAVAWADTNVDGEPIGYLDKREYFYNYETGMMMFHNIAFPNDVDKQLGLSAFSSDNMEAVFNFGDINEEVPETVLWNSDYSFQDDYWENIPAFSIFNIREAASVDLWNIALHAHWNTVPQNQSAVLHTLLWTIPRLERIYYMEGFLSSSFYAHVKGRT